MHARQRTKRSPCADKRHHAERASVVPLTAAGSGGRLAGKTALITGTAGGQGRAAAVLFAAQGAVVVGCDIDEAGALETVSLVREAGGAMHSQQPVDLSDRAQVEAWIAWAARTCDGFDILYNNAS